jgi:hypothetical protein
MRSDGGLKDRRRKWHGLEESNLCLENGDFVSVLLGEFSKSGALIVTP